MVKKIVKNKPEKYDPLQIEPRWQKKWKDVNLHEFKLEPNLPAGRQGKTYYNLVELPYPSGDLHLGHWFSFVTADVHARYKKMEGYNVFFPNGFDAFGLPAENAAIKRHIHPKDWTMSNIQTMHKQFDTMGTMIDWSHEAITCLPEYYRWNQWIFLKLFEKGLAYRGKTLSNWCPSCQTVLANENIEAGKCWRCGSEVVQKEIEQWFLKLTAYADKLIWPENPSVDWPTSVRVGQNNWIGRKEGIEIEYRIKNQESRIKVFTTRPDTNFGATFIAIAPEHSLAKKITTMKYKKAVDAYIKQSTKKTEMERKAEGREKTGVFTGAYAINQLTGYEMPIWVSDFVLAGYGTGALVGVPAHDIRDFEFAQKFGLKIIRVVVGSDGDKSPITRIEQIQEEDGTMINSRFLDGMDIHVATEKIMDYLVEKGWGKRVTTYHIHDWSISRQRYWGTPVPIIYCKNCAKNRFSVLGSQFSESSQSVVSSSVTDKQKTGKLKSENRKQKTDNWKEGVDYSVIDGEEYAIVPIPLDQLPVELPYEVDFTPKGEPPLATAKEWINVTCPKCGGEAKRDAETMDTFFDSSWYYYRYTDPQYEDGPFDKLRVKKLLPVDIYYGGAEHTLGHTLYARFFTKFFKDLGLVSFDEFAKKRVQHGVILGPDGNRMSKSKGNVVNPDDIVKQYGTDTVRTYLSFMMPYEATSPWSPDAIWGVYRFLKRIWELQDRLEDGGGGTEISNEDKAEMYKTVQKVGEDIHATKFNTAVAAIMTWLNYLSAKEMISEEEYRNLLIVIAPFAPHMAEEIWQSKFSGDKKNTNSFRSIHQQKWPSIDAALLKEQVLTIIIQINGKMRETIRSKKQEARSKDRIIEIARESQKVTKYLEGKKILKTIYVEGKIINFVVK